MNIDVVFFENPSTGLRVGCKVSQLPSGSWELLAYHQQGGFIRESSKKQFSTREAAMVKLEQMLAEVESFS